MSAEAALAVRSWKAGRYTCTLTVQRPRAGALVSCVIEWAPQVPHRLTDGEISEYRAGRNTALAELSAELGINAAVIEL
jgi:hypothetical protein